MVACREAYPHLAKAGGSIINIGSFFDRMGVPNNLAYCASKAAVGAITRCLAVEWAKDKIRVIDVAPGYIETDLNREHLARDKVQAWMKSRIPVGRPGTPDEVARLVAALLVEDIPFMTGETIYLDGGHGMNH
jgi:NAD(P)-dependent dehydrogenase (short-subunit alcohol dehydrogenase family)